MARPTGTDSASLRKLVVDLKSAGSSATGLKAELRRSIKAAAAPLKAQIQADYLALPSTNKDSGVGNNQGRDAKGRFTSAGTGGTLRKALANATTVKTSLTANKIVVGMVLSSAKMGAARANLPNYVEGTAAKPWRHMLFGNRKNWYPQGATPVLTARTEEYAAEVKEAIQAAVEVVATKLEKGI